MTQRQNLKIKVLHYEPSQQTTSALKLPFCRKLIELGFRFEIKENKTDNSEERRINTESVEFSCWVLDLFSWQKTQQTLWGWVMKFSTWLN